MKVYLNELNGQGVRSVRGAKLTLNSLWTIRHNRSYTGVYRFSDIVIKGGIPQLVSEELFEQVKPVLTRTSAKGRKSPAARERKPPCPAAGSPGICIVGIIGNLCREFPERARRVRSIEPHQGFDAFAEK